MAVNLCKEEYIKLEAHYRLDKGFLSERHLEFYLRREGIKVEIDDLSIRSIRLISDSLKSFNYLYGKLVVIEELLFLFQGFFMPIISVDVFSETNKKMSESAICNIISQRPHFFKSEKNLGLADKICDWDCNLNESVFEKWLKVQSDLGPALQIFLYACADTGMTIDIRCAFLIEFAETMCELKKLDVKEDDSLRDKLKKLINEHGALVFGKEMHSSFSKIIRAFVKTRVSVFHVKDKKASKMLNGQESRIYLYKFSYFYRALILELLGIDKSQMETLIKNRIEQFDKLDGIIDSFIYRIVNKKKHLNS
jgi:hypothetical protein